MLFMPSVKSTPKEHLWASGDRPSDRTSPHCSLTYRLSGQQFTYISTSSGHASFWVKCFINVKIIHSNSYNILARGSHSAITGPCATSPFSPFHKIYMVVTWVVYLIYLAIVPIYFLYLALLYLLLPRPCSSWTLFQRIDTRFGKLQSTLLAWWLTPKSCVMSGKVEAWKIYPDEVQTEKLEVEIVSLQPIERKMFIRSLLDVKPTVRSRFTIIPKNHHVSASNKCASSAAYTQRASLVSFDFVSHWSKWRIH